MYEKKCLECNSTFIGKSFQKYCNANCRRLSFNARHRKKECFNYLNLQPLWAIDNIKKGSKIIGGK